MWYNQLFEDAFKSANYEKAPMMKKYMRNQFEFLGIQAGSRKKLSKEYFKIEKKKKAIDWKFIDACWEMEYREFQYIAEDYISYMAKFLEHDDIFKIKSLIVKKSWWDTIDGLVRVIGGIVLKYPELEELMIEWSMDDNFWVRRSSILHQLLRKEETNEELLEKIIVNNFNDSEFFINKAIGWALRDYSKTNNVWVKEFIEKYNGDLNSLSIREGSKYLK